MMSVMGSNISGDVIPLTPLEQLYATFVTLVSRVFIAFIYAEASTFMSMYYSAYIEHLNKTNLIIDWLKYNSCNQRIAERVKCYREILWSKCKGVDDQQLIADMPKLLRRKIQLMTLQQLLQRSNFIPGSETGAIVSLVQQLSIKMFPKGEFIIYTGEIALDAFFIIEGLVELYDINANFIERLGAGRSFGELETFGDRARKSPFTAYCSANATLAVLRREDFARVKDQYPEFKEAVDELVRKQAKIRELGESLRKSSRVSRESGASTEKGVPDEELELRIAKFSMQALTSIKASKTMNENDLFNKINRGTTKRKYCLYIAHMVIATCASLYNLIFIPLQTAFRITLTLPFYCIELFILVLFVLDIAIWIAKYKKHSTANFEEYARAASSLISGRKVHSVAKKKRIVWMICFEVVALVPWYVIMRDVHYPTFLIFGIKLIRAMKVWPIKRLLSKIKKRFPNTVRICEMLLLYTLFNHLMACSYILMMYVAKVKNDSWVKRVPFPIPDMQGFRKGDDMTGVTDADVYCHAIYFAYMIFTHISIGDICAVNVEERVLMCFYILVTFYIYAFLFANMTSMITDFYKGLLSNLQQVHEEILQSVKAESLPSSLVNRIKDYFEFLWINTRGIDDKFLGDFPVSLKTDIYLQIYRKALESSLIFKKANGHFDKRAAASFLKMVVLRKYMQGDILVKAGSATSKLYFVLDGSLVVIGADQRVVKRVTAGALLDGRLGEDSDRQMAHIVATSISTVAVIVPSTLTVLIQVFPYIQSNAARAKEQMFQNYRDVTIPTLIEQDFSKLTAEKFLEQEYTRATEGSYDAVVQAAAKEVSNERDAPTGYSRQEPRISDRLLIEGNGVNRPRCFLRPTMKYYYLVYVTNIVNMFITAITIPLDVAYLIDYSWTYLIIESLCLLESIINVVVKFRTAVLLRGPVYSYKFKDILKAYWGNGLLFDLFGLAPFSVVFPYLNVREPLYLVLALKLLRVGIIFNVMNAIRHIEQLNYKISSVMSIFAVFSGFIFLLHFSSAMWYFVNNQIERNEPLTWEKFNHIENRTLIEKITHSIYYTTKIVTGVGSGESFPATNLERVITCALAHIGIVLFTVVFGLIAALTSSWTYDMEVYLRRKTQLDDFAEAFHLSDENKRQLSEYHEYVKDVYYRPNTYKRAKELLPTPLVSEIVYETNKNFVLQVFQGIACLNFIKKLAYRIQIEHYLPGDYIMYKGDVGEEAYYIADGSASILKADKRTVFSRIKKGVSFGEIGLFLKCRRTYYVQAETHCCVYVLKRSDVHALLKKFPDVEVRVRNYSEMLLSKIQEREAKIDNDEKKFLDNLSTIMEEKAIKDELTKPPLTTEERKQFELVSTEELKHTQSPVSNLREELNRLIEAEDDSNAAEVADRLQENAGEVEVSVHRPAPRQRLSQIAFDKHLNVAREAEPDD